MSCMFGQHSQIRDNVADDDRCDRPAYNVEEQSSESGRP